MEVVTDLEIEAVFLQTLLKEGISEEEAKLVAPLLNTTSRSPQEQALVNKVWRQVCVNKRQA